jgi:sugar lactone lactonase YvrE
MRRPVVAAVVLALAATACRDTSTGRPVAKPGRVVTVVDDDVFDGRGIAEPGAIAVGPDGTIYAIDGFTAYVENEEGQVSTLLAFPPRGLHRLVAGFSLSKYWSGRLEADEVVDPFPRLRQRGLGLRNVAIGPDGTVFVSDFNNLAVWALAPDGRSRTVAGTGEQASSGDGGPATLAALEIPTALATNPENGDLYIGGHDRRVRKIDAAGVITTVAGDGAPGLGGDGGPAVKAHLTSVDGIAVDARSGDVYLCDARVIRRIDAAGTISRVAGTGSFPAEPSPTGRPAADTSVDCSGVAVDPRDGVLYFADSLSNQIRRVTRSGLVEAVGGNGKKGRSGNGNKAVQEPMEPYKLAIDRQGNLFFFAFVKSEVVIQMIGARPPL